MTVTTTTTNGAAQRRAALVAGGRSPAELPTRRRWGRVAAGSCLALLGGLLFAVLYLSAGRRVEVLVAADDIAPYEVIERSDLRVERVAADPDVATIDGADIDEVVGRTAAAYLPEGALIAPDQIYAEDARIVGPGEAEAGVLLAPGQAPRGLQTGDEVIVGVAPAPGSGGEPLQVRGWVVDLGEPDDRTGERTASVVVPREAALTVGTAGDRVSLMVVRSG